jgi:hypothetical protein
VGHPQEAEREAVAHAGTEVPRALKYNSEFICDRRILFIYLFIYLFIKHLARRD